MSTDSAPQQRIPQAPQASWWIQLWRPFWALPAAMAGGAVVLGAVLPQIDVRLGASLPIAFPGGADGARGMLSTIATAMISVTGLVFSITIVVLQLASSQFTPRVLATFLESRIVQVTLGVFTGTFLYALTVLRSVRGTSGSVSSFVPQTSVTAAFLFVVASVAMFLAFIHHITSTVQVSRVISDTGERSIAAARRIYGPAPEDDEEDDRGRRTWSPEPGTDRTPLAAKDRHGTATVLDGPGLVAWARDHDVVVSLDVSPGDFVAGGQRLGWVWGGADLDGSDLDRAARFVWLERERRLAHDYGMGLRQLVDIAERALSPGINDPTTAVQVVDELHNILRDLVVRRDPSAYLRDDDDVVRVVHRPLGFAAALDLAVDEIAHYGADSLQIPVALRRMLEDLRDAAGPTHRPAVEVKLAALDQDAGNAEAPA